MSASLAETLKRETRELHTQVERSPFMRALLGGTLDIDRYGALLRNLHAIYAALEPALLRHAHDPRLSPLMLDGLAREALLRGDLQALYGEGWMDAFALQPAAMRYVARLHLLGEQHPELLAAHSYVRYLGDLSGGQILARIVQSRMGLPVGEGTAFYDFGNEAQLKWLKDAYRAGLDRLTPAPTELRAIVEEAQLAFELHQVLFNELDCTRITCR